MKRKRSYVPYAFEHFEVATPGANNMKNENRHTEAREQYTAAHDTHYTTKDLREALQLYRGIMVAYPNTEEAGYARSQIQNIVNAVVPKQELLDAQLDLALARIGDPDQEGVEPDPVTRPASEAAT